MRRLILLFVVFTRIKDFLIRFLQSTKKLLVYQEQKWLLSNYVILGSDGGHFENNSVFLIKSRK